MNYLMKKSNRVSLSCDDKGGYVYRRGGKSADPRKWDHIVIKWPNDDVSREEIYFIPDGRRIAGPLGLEYYVPDSHPYVGFGLPAISDRPRICDLINHHGCVVYAIL